MTAAVERRRIGGRGGLAIGLVGLNVILAAMNLDKHDVLPFNLGADAIFSDEGDDVATEGALDEAAATPGDATGDTTGASVVAGDETSTTVTGEPVGEEAGASVAEWPGGLPEAPPPDQVPVARVAEMQPDGSLQLLGDVPDWATAQEVIRRSSNRMPRGNADVTQLFHYHPDASADAASGDVVFRQQALFEIGSSDLNEEALLRLDYVVDIMTQNPTLLATIVGHTDDTGTEEANAQLGFERADTMRTYLIENGVAEAQIVVATAGEDIAELDALSGREANRRVELRIKNFFSPTGL